MRNKLRARLVASNFSVTGGTVTRSSQSSPPDIERGGQVKRPMRDEELRGKKQKMSLMGGRSLVSFISSDDEDQIEFNFKVSVLLRIALFVFPCLCFYLLSLSLLGVHVEDFNSNQSAL